MVSEQQADSSDDRDQSDDAERSTKLAPTDPHAHASHA
jgi:hypothetical protein